MKNGRPRHLSHLFRVETAAGRIVRAFMRDAMAGKCGTIVCPVLALPLRDFQAPFFLILGILGFHEA